MRHCLICFTMLFLWLNPAFSQQLQTLMPEFNKGDKAVYEFSFNIVSTNINEETKGLELAAYDVLLSNNIHPIYKYAKNQSKYTSRFALTLLETTPYNNTFKLEIITPSSIINEGIEADHSLLKHFMATINTTPLVITFPKDMSSFIVNNKREIIKSLAQTVWGDLVIKPDSINEIIGSIPTEEEAINHFLKEFSDNEFLEYLSIICPGFNSFMQAYCKPYIIGEHVMGNPLVGHTTDEVYETQLSYLDQDSTFHHDYYTEFFRNINYEQDEQGNLNTNMPQNEITKEENSKEKATSTNSGGDARCSIQITFAVQPNSWIDVFRVISKADLDGSLWIAHENLKQIAQ